MSDRCAGCGGPLESATAGFTDRGLSCQACVLGSLGADEEQAKAGYFERSEEELSSYRRRRGVVGVARLAISAALWAHDESARETQWIDDELVFIPSFGRGVRVLQVTDEAIVEGTIGRDEATAEGFGSLEGRDGWRTIADEVREHPLAKLEQIIRMPSGDLSFEFEGNGRLTLEREQAARMGPHVERRLVGWRWTKERRSLRSVLLWNGCFGVIALAIGGGLSTLAAAIGGAVGRWGGISLLALTGLALLLVAVVTVSMVRERPIEEKLRPSSGGAPYR